MYFAPEITKGSYTVVSARLFADVWQKENTDGRGSSSNTLASREDVMMVLANVEHVLIRYLSDKLQLILKRSIDVRCFIYKRSIFFATTRNKHKKHRNEFCSSFKQLEWKYSVCWRMSMSSRLHRIIVWSMCILINTIKSIITTERAKYYILL